ncbi:uncharacterized protein LOC110420626 isoform X2 [Herrania umbratica]|uniref:Uncharacterized protein LOC110420626 isoform X2 n=1 Tax=Herrania umbratica TaxID=108875 RepID=A0A6J1AS10_9ROSI|nr:uncharacterized protein LOC110420626 isoform X2 [Herrania umbratica]
MSNTQSPSSGCFSAVFRRLLCSGSPQTHPSEDIKESNTNGFVGDQAKVQVQTSESGPGIVARLMGLDSLPEKDWVQKGQSPGPVTRSRSVNFMDYMLEFDLTNAKHRRVKTSASFREVPQGPQLLQHNHNHEFLVVYLDSADNRNEAGFKPRKSEKGDGSSSKHDKQKENVREKVACKKENQEKNKKIAKLKNEPRRVSGKHSLKAGSCISGAKDVQINRGANSKAKRPLEMVNQKEASGLTRKKKNQRELKKVEYSENNSEGSSPVSVLNVNDFTAHQENSISELRSLELKSEKKWSSKSEKHDSPAMDFSARISITEGLGKQEYTKKNFELTGIEETEYYMELVGKPCKLTEEDIKFSNWIEPKKVFTFEDFEEICAEFGEQLLDLMMHQVADELVGFHMQITGL